MASTKQNICRDAISAYNKFNERYDSVILEKDSKVAMILPDSITDIKETVIEAATKVQIAKKMLDSNSKHMAKYECMQENLRSRHDKLKDI